MTHTGENSSDFTEAGKKHNQFHDVICSLPVGNTLLIVNPIVCRILPITFTRIGQRAGFES